MFIKIIDSLFVKVIVCKNNIYFGEDINLWHLFTSKNHFITMEVGQADQVENPKQVYMNKWYSHSLATNKVVYARDEDPSNTMIIRNLYPQCKEYNKIFGLKDSTYIRTLFLSILMAFKMEMETLQKRVRYVRREEFEEIHRAIVEMNDVLEKELLYDMSEDEGGVAIRFYTGLNYVNVKVSSSVEFPIIRLCNEDKEKRYVNSATLFIGEGIKLLRYINSRFNITYTEVLKFKCKRNEENFKTDNFF